MKVRLHKMHSKREQIVDVLLHIKEHSTNAEWVLVSKMGSTSILVSNDTVLYATEEGRKLLEQGEEDVHDKLWVRVNGQWPEGNLIHGDIMTNAEAVGCLQEEESF